MVNVPHPTKPVVCAIGFLLALLASLRAVTADAVTPLQPPHVDFVYPPAVGWLADASVTLTGELGSSPIRGWCDDPGIIVTRGASNAVFHVTVTTNASPGLRWLRFENEAGVSDWLPLVLSDREERIANPGTNAPMVESVTSLPVAVNSRLLSDGLTNLIVVTTRTNQLLEVKLQGLGLDLPVGARLQIRDERGVVLASASTTNSADPTVSAPMFNEARWQIEVTPLTNFPACAFATSGVPFRLLLDAVELPTQRKPDGTVILAPHPDMQRPNLTPRISFPGLVNGFVSDPLQQDYYGFDATAGDAYWMRLKTASISSPLRGVLRILDADRNVLIESVPGPDPMLAWTAPGTGRFGIVVAAEPGSGGADCMYQLELGQPRVQLAATVSAHTLALEPGGSAALELRVVKPPTFDQLLVVTVQGLPAGVTAAPVHLMAEMDRATITVSAAADLAPTNVACQVMLMTAAPPILVEPAHAPVVGRFAAPGKLLRNETAHFWVTVKPREPAR